MLKKIIQRLFSNPIAENCSACHLFERCAPYFEQGRTDFRPQGCPDVAMGNIFTSPGLGTIGRFSADLEIVRLLGPH